MPRNGGSLPVLGDVAQREPDQLGGRLIARKVSLVTHRLADRGIQALVERTSRFVILVKLPEKRTEVVVDALVTAVRKLPAVLRKSLTWDRGSELTEHARFTVATDVKVYFCDPYSPWQRGSNENTNGLLRQYYPKGMDLSAVTQTQLDVVARKLNTRLRETLNRKTPAYILETSVSATH